MSTQCRLIRLKNSETDLFCGLFKKDQDTFYTLSLALGTTNLEEGKTVFGQPLTMLTGPAGNSDSDLPLGPIGEKTYAALAHLLQEGRQADLESVANAVAAYYGHVPTSYPDNNAERLEFNENLGMVRAAIFDGNPEVAVEAARRAAPYLPRPFADVEHTTLSRTCAAPWTPPVPVDQVPIGPGAPWVQPLDSLDGPTGAFFAFPISEAGLRVVETHVGPVDQEFHGTTIDLIDTRHLDDSLSEKERETLPRLTEAQWDRQLDRVQAKQMTLYRGAAVDSTVVPNKFGTPVERQIALERNMGSSGRPIDEDQPVGLADTLLFAQEMYQSLCYLEGCPERSDEQPFLDGYSPWPDDEADLVANASTLTADVETSPKCGLGCQGLGLWLDVQTRIPALKGALPILVDDLNTNLKQ